MEGAWDFAEGSRGPQDNYGGGPNWDQPYRDEFCNSAIGGALAVALTEGGKALWNNPAFFDYFLNFHCDHEKNRVAVDSNGIKPFPGAMLTARCPVDPIAPTLTLAKVDTSTLWLRFSRSLDETDVVPPPTSRCG